MKAEDIIEGLNRYIDIVRKERGISTKGHIVLHREILPHSSFKVYKTYTYTLWFSNGKKCNKIVTLQQTNKVPDSLEENMLREMNIHLSTMIFTWIRSEKFDEVINGEYGRENSNV